MTPRIRFQFGYPEEDVRSSVGQWAPLIVGSVVLAMFLPFHIAIWSKFPVWYHLTFLLTIIPAVLMGALLLPRRNEELNSAAR